jgi:hypothetical protein
MCKRIIGSPGTWEVLLVSSVISRLETPGDQLQAPAVHSSVGERTERVNAGGTAKLRKRSAAEWAAGNHSVLIVPLKLVNGPLPEPVEGSETPDHGTVFENHDGCLEIRPSCHRNRNG